MRAARSGLIRNASVLLALSFALASCARTGPTTLTISGDSKANIAEAQTGQHGAIRVLSWNISKDSPVRDPEAFKAVVASSHANILLLDEVKPTVTEQQIRDALPEPDDAHGRWHISYGSSGGHQRDVIVSRMPLEPVAEFQGILPYPEASLREIQDGMAEAGFEHPGRSTEIGIAVNGAIVRSGSRRLLAVSLDLECCGSLPIGWEEQKRRIEVREIRRLIRAVLNRTRVDGVIVGGDFNLVMTGLPLVILSGPYPAPHGGLIAAELMHVDSDRTWTWDGRGTPFPSRALDFLFYSPGSLSLDSGYILDTEDFSPAELQHWGLAPESSSTLSDHRPLVAGFSWTGTSTN
ncbi:MAG: endonuclease/exonuclease/phosphatase family protein [Xanthomonadales bacterium]|nr:endonuclease/exonuclease/phosphatase family protein [Xanthomonadales bacterium]